MLGCVGEPYQTHKLSMKYLLSGTEPGFLNKLSFSARSDSGATTPVQVE